MIMEKDTSKPEVQQQPKKKPNDIGAIQVQDFLKIFDPNTQEKFVVRDKGK